MVMIKKVGGAAPPLGFDREAKLNYHKKMGAPGSGLGTQQTIDDFPSLAPISERYSTV